MASKKSIGFFISFLFGVSVGAQTIKDLCANDRVIQIISTREAYKKNHCELLEHYKNIDLKYGKLSDSMVKIVDKLSEKDWQESKDLRATTVKMAGLLNQATPQGAEMPSAFHKALQAYKDKWQAVEKRSAPALQKEYFADINELLAKMKIGQEVLRCYEATQSETVKNRPPEFTTTENEMAFRLTKDDGQPPSWSKTILFSVTTEPLVALTLYAHELQHGCNAIEWAKTREEILRSEVDVSRVPKNDPKRSSVVRAHNAKYEQMEQDSAIDELRAYTVSAKTVKELAFEAPEITCNHFFAGGLFGPQALRVSEYGGKLEQMLADGSFAPYIMKLYTDDKLYDRESIYESGDNRKPDKFRKDLIERVRSQGYNFTEPSIPK